MKSKFLKTFILAGIFGFSYLGFASTSSQKRVAGMTVSHTVLSIANQAQAYCNEATGAERDNGSCTGQMNDATTRCLLSSASTCIAGA